MKRRIFIVGVIIMIVCGTVAVTSCSSFGAKSTGDRLKLIEQSENYANGIFINTIPTEVETTSYFNLGWQFLFGGSSYRTPKQELKTEKIDNDSLLSLENNRATVVWLGHATTLLKINDTFILTDPVFSNRVSPFSFIGPKRFFNSPIEISELPILDAVIISHDHYDHLDERSITELDNKVKFFVVPLGIGAHLEKWGIEKQKIIEKDWWESFQVNESVELVCTPARHFSGRGMFDRNKTLWASWVILGTEERIYFGGDTGIFPGFKEIGEKYGPFDLTLLPIGAYGKYWPDIHMSPEEAVEAHLNLKGGLLIPIHWATFDLALHGWYEPAERLSIAGQDANINFIIPKAGAIVTTKSDGSFIKWWTKIPFVNEKLAIE